MLDVLAETGTDGKEAFSILLNADGFSILAEYESVFMSPIKVSILSNATFSSNYRKANEHKFIPGIYI